MTVSPSLAATNRKKDPSSHQGGGVGKRGKGRGGREREG